MEDGGERWSKPYVASLPLHSLLELRCCLQRGALLLDVSAATMEEVAGQCAAMCCLSPLLRFLMSSMLLSC